MHKQTVIKRAIVVPLLIIYIAILVWLIVFKLYWPPQQTMRSLNVIPFAQSMVNWQGEVLYEEIIFNLLVFIPFGVLLGILMKREKFPAILFPIFLVHYASKRYSMCSGSVPLDIGIHGYNYEYSRRSRGNRIGYSCREVGKKD